MTDHMGFVIAVAFKWLVVFGLGYLSYELMQAGKDGWGWLIFLAVLACGTSYKTTDDKHKEGE